MTVFVDTSAVLAFLDRSDRGHEAIVASIERIGDEELVTHAYVVVESLALVRSRLGPAAAIALIDDVLPGFRVFPVDGELHDEAVRSFRAAGASGSVVDRTSFAFMRRERVERALTLDADFSAAGFSVVP